MKVLHLRSSAFLGSPEKLILTQAQGLAGRAQSSVAVLPDGDDAFLQAAQAQGLDAWKMPKNPWSAARSLALILETGGFDVLCTHDCASNLVGRWAAWRAMVPQVAVFHGRTSHNLKMRFYEFLDNLVLRGVSRVVAVSEATRGQVSSLDGKVSVIRNALDVRQPSAARDLRRELNLSEQDVVFCTAGRLSAEKGHAMLLEAFEKVLAACPQAVLLIAGEGEERARLTARAKAIPGDRAKFLGFMQDVSSLYAASDVFVLPSFREGLPLVLLEAAAAGLPAVAADVGGVKEAVSHRKTGLLVPPGDAGTLAREMIALAQNKETRQRLGRAARLRVEQEFSPETFARAYLDVYESVRPHVLWVSWEKHRRTREIAGALDAPLVELTSSLPAGLRQISLLARTTALLFSRRPRTLMVQCPSLVLGAWAAVLKPWLGYRLVVDAHNEAVKPFNYTFDLYQDTIAFLHRRADLTIVTNSRLEETVRGHKGRVLVLPDKIPALPQARAQGAPSAAPVRVAFICTFAPDEPYGEVIEAARLLGPEISWAVTGRATRADPAVVRGAPRQVRFTGFLSEEDYLKLLQDADVLMDLTLMEDCLVCGAYEAVALGKPLVTSDTQALRAHFSRGAVYAQPNRADLARAVREALEKKDQLSLEMRTLKQELASDWSRRRDQLKGYLESDPRPALEEAAS